MFHINAFHLDARSFFSPVDSRFWQLLMNQTKCCGQCVPYCTSVYHEKRIQYVCMHAVDIGIAQQNTETTVTQREQMRQFVMENEQNLDRTRLPYIMRIILWFVTMALVAENALHSWDEWTFCCLLWLLKKLPFSYQLCKHDKTVGLRLTLCSFVIFN